MMIYHFRFDVWENEEKEKEEGMIIVPDIISSNFISKKKYNSFFNLQHIH